MQKQTDIKTCKYASKETIDSDTILKIVLIEVKNLQKFGFEILSEREKSQVRAAQYEQVIYIKMKSKQVQTCPNNLMKIEMANVENPVRSQRHYVKMIIIRISLMPHVVLDKRGNSGASVR